MHNLLGKHRWTHTFSKWRTSWNQQKHTGQQVKKSTQDSRWRSVLVLRATVVLTPGANPKNHSTKTALMPEWCMDNLIGVSALKEQLKPFLAMMNGLKSGWEFITKRGTPTDPTVSFSLLQWQPGTLVEPLGSQLQDLQHGPQEPIPRRVSTTWNLM